MEKSAVYLIYWRKLVFSRVFIIPFVLQRCQGTRPGEVTGSAEAV